jgi:hypothetical protein
MNFPGTVAINAPGQKVWQYLTDPEKVSECAPEVESVEVIIPNLDDFLPVHNLDSLAASAGVAVRDASAAGIFDPYLLRRPGVEGCPRVSRSGNELPKDGNDSR